MCTNINLLITSIEVFILELCKTQFLYWPLIIKKKYPENILKSINILSYSCENSFSTCNVKSAVLQFKCQTN